MTIPAGYLATEVEGRRYVYAKRQNNGFGPDEFTFDAGEHWYPTPLAAYESAKLAGKLVPEGAADGKPDELVAITQELLGAIASLKPGEELRLRHTGAAIVVLRETSVLAFRPSALEEAGIVPEKKAEPVDG